jgi:hypothetical protein
VLLLVYTIGKPELATAPPSKSGELNSLGSMFGKLMVCASRLTLKSIETLVAGL